MVNFVTDKNKIIELWQEAFGDSRGEILYFTDNLKNGKCIGISEVDELASMLFLVKCNFGSYIYAACTRKKYRGGGYMTQLLITQKIMKVRFVLFLRAIRLLIFITNAALQSMLILRIFALTNVTE